MKVGTLVGGLKVEDVKLIRHNNLIQVFRQVMEYQEQGYVINLNSVRDSGVVKSLYMYKLEKPMSEVKTESKSEVEAPKKTTTRKPTESKPSVNKED